MGQRQRQGQHLLPEEGIIGVDLVQDVVDLVVVEEVDGQVRDQLFAELVVLFRGEEIMDGEPDS